MAERVCAGKCGISRGSLRFDEGLHRSALFFAAADILAGDQNGGEVSGEPWRGFILDFDCDTDDNRSDAMVAERHRKRRTLLAGHGELISHSRGVGSGVIWKLSERRLNQGWPFSGSAVRWQAIVVR
ncbi:hypothetical protein IVA98_27405 [Bradyrhizobium sp. 160]|nr:hypothetical protein [Bradyrhizobium sp. 160]